ncbi:hypothetical protein [Nocardia sp. BMG51109]|uniref:Rv0361 family membrane protein n=1 Tax=Nocardia sp. BMG51109 TaxID=1056816 RepID=UPI0004676B2C|nr:hypothetical protein [Nocardia sp. BMG51109]
MTYPSGEQPPGPLPGPQPPLGYAPPQPPSYYPPEGYPPLAPAEQHPGTSPQPYPGASQQPYPGTAQQPYPGAPPPRRRIGRIVLPLVLVLAALGGSVATAALLIGRGAAASDEQKVELAVRDFYDTIAADGVDAAMAKSCHADRAEYAALPGDQRSMIADETMPVRIDAIDHILIDGDRATATVHGTMAEESTLAPGLGVIDSAPEFLRKEDGDWKVCAAENR